MTEQEERIRGADAEHLLANAMMREALETIEARLIDKLASADTKPDEALRLQAILVGKRRFEYYLKQIIQTGKMAEIVEEQKRSLADRILRRA